MDGVVIEIKRILCPIDFSEASRHALDHAVALAGWYGGHVSTLHIYEPAPAGASGTLMGPYPFRPIPTVIDVSRMREALGDFVRAAGAPDPVDVCIEPGRTADVIVDRARTLPADLIAIGTHGVGGFDHLVLGSVAEKVLRKATCPVLTVPPRVRVTSKLPFRRLLCPVDFSDSSVAALHMAFSIAQESDAELTILHVLEGWPSEEALEGDAVLAPYYRTQEGEMAHRLERLIPESVRDWCVPKTRLGRGKSYREILGIATEDGADLIVMGVHGRNVLDLMLFGSTTNHVVRRATCPVLTVRR